ncbi:MAG: FKBP-type peptidyl-prolyl cis-trans isomerase [Prevotella sp.]|nr:FKBP-type peptidyl-prolyl cis-trans isomerase [Prevotella sp.]
MKTVHTFHISHGLLRRFPLLLLLLGAVLMTACSESDNDVDEYADWQNRNQEWFTNLYNATRQKVASGDASWKIIKVYSRNDDVVGSPDDYIIVHVLNEGTGSGCPLVSDTVRVHYRGRLIPTVSYAEGKVFDQSFSGDYNLLMMTPVKLGVSNVVDGFATALINMHIGDRWEVYIPQKLAYGSSSSSGSVPAYSNLIFDLTLAAYYHPGQPVPDWKAGDAFWEPEE